MRSALVHRDPVTGALYDPRDHGARCDECPLKDRAVVVPPEIRPGHPIVVAMEPGDTEEREGAPLVGPSGKEMARAMRAVGLARSDFSYTNARLCAFALAASRPAQNRAAYDACRPRLEREVAQAPFVVVFGGEALEAVSKLAVSTGGLAGRGEAGLKAVRGFPFEIDVRDLDASTPEPGAATEAPHRKIRLGPVEAKTRRIGCLVMNHPAALFRTRGLTKYFRADFAKTARLLRGESTWTPPEAIADPTRDVLANVLGDLAASDDLVVCDVETRRASGSRDKADPFTAALRCVGIGDARRAVVAHFESCETPPRRFACPPGVARDLVARFFRDERLRLGGHNFLEFDWTVLARHGMPPPPMEKIVDTILLAHAVDPMAPKSLRHWVSFLTDAPAWKPKDHDAWDNDAELACYCAHDVVLTRQIATKLARLVQERAQAPVYRSDRRFQEICVGMSAAGLFVNEPERVRHRARLEKKRDDARERFCAAMLPGICLDRVSHAPLNLASPEQLRVYLFDIERLPRVGRETESGQQSTGIDVLNELLTLRLPPRVATLLDALQDYRRAGNWLKTFVDGLAPGPDGRVHTTYSAYATSVGRVVSRDPNVNNVPSIRHDSDSLRSIVCAAPGSVFVYADMAQFHLRLIAPIAQDPIWLEAFARHEDVHRVNAARYGGKKIESVSKEEREFWKTNVYALCYLATVETFLAALKKVKNRAGERPYAQWTLEMASDVYDGFFKDHACIPRWWEREIKEFHRRRYVVDSVLGRRCDFEDAQDKGDDQLRDVVNYRVLATEGAIMGGAGAAGRVVERVPFGLYGPGLVHHGYDSAMVEVRKEHEALARRALVESMTTTFMGVEIPVDVKSGQSWSALS